MGVPNRAARSRDRRNRLKDYELRKKWQVIDYPCRRGASYQFVGLLPLKQTGRYEIFARRSHSAGIATP